MTLTSFFLLHRSNMERRWRALVARMAWRRIQTDRTIERWRWKQAQQTDPYERYY